MISLENSCGYACLSPAACLKVTGDDALSFLQGQLTQELRADRMGAAPYALLLSQKGKVVADAFVLRVSPKEVWLVSYRVPAAVIRERLEGFIIADDVVIDDLTEAYALLTLIGDRAGDWLRTQVGSLPDSGAMVPAPSGGWVFGGRRGCAENWEWLAPRVALPVPPLAVLSADDLEKSRLQAGIPAIPDDLGPADLPNEGGLESVAISYTKGCYLGQEVMARLKAMGQVRRRLTRVTGLGSFPAERPATLYQSGKRVGEVRTWVADGAGGWLGLAMLSLLSLDANAPLSLSPAGPGTITVVGES